MEQNSKNENIGTGNDKLLSDIKSKQTYEATELAENIINTVREPLLILDKDLRVVKASQSFFGYFKVIPEETIGTLIYDLGNRQWDIPKLKELLEKILPEKTTFDNYEVAHNFARIGDKVLLLNARQIERAFGKEKIILLAIEDITDRKSEEAILAESNRVTSKYLDILLDRSHIPIIIWNSAFEIVRFNQAFEKLTGYHLDELKNQKLDVLFPEEKINSTLELIKVSIDNDEMAVIEVDILTKTKQIKTVIWNSENIYDESEVKIVATMAQDITERKQSEDALKESEEIFNHFLANSPYYVFFKDKNIRTLRLSTNYEQMFGKPLKSLLGKTMDELFPSELAKEMIEVDKEILKKRETVIVDEEFNGRYYTTIKFPIIINNEHRYLAGFTIDITERKQVEAKLNDSFSLLRIAGEKAKLGGWSVNLAENRVYWSDEVAAIHEMPSGFSPQVEDQFSFYAPEWREKIREVFTACAQEGISFDEEMEIITAGKKRVFIRTLGEAVRDEEGKIYKVHGAFQDITESKLAQEEIIMLAHSLESINECVSITDLKNKIIFVNQAFKDTYGYKENELIGKQIAMVQSKKNPQEYLKGILSATIQGGWRGELINRRKDGSEFPVFLSTSIVYDQNSKPLGLIGVASDITAQKQMVDNLLKFSRAVEQSPTSIIITDLKGNIEYINPKATESTGYHTSELLGKNPRIFGTGEKPAYDYKVLWDTINSGKEWRGEFHNKKKNGELYWESALISPIKNENGEVTHLIGIKEDITEKKKIMEELILAKEKAEEMNRLKSNFLANMSHELRTPLVGMLGFAEIICQENVSTEIRTMAENIYKSGNRLSQTLNLILDLSQLESEKSNIKYQKLELINETKEILTSFEEAARKKGLSIIASFSAESIFINFDERAYNSIISNLINNAIKFTIEGSITISVLLYHHSVEIKVSDTGIGIAEKDYHSIFEEFRQVSEGLSRNFEGSGLGLNITKKLVEKYGGTITVESEVGKGSTFKVILPVKNGVENLKEPTAAEMHSSTNPPITELDKPLVLLVDDDPLVFQVMKRYLRDYVELETTVDSEFAAKMLSKKKYDLIFMDINLRRGMDGKEAVSIIRNMGGYENTPIVAVTAYAMAGDKEEFILAGCSHYLSKPFTKTEIVNIITTALKR